MGKQLLDDVTSFSSNKSYFVDHMKPLECSSTDDEMWIGWIGPRGNPLFAKSASASVVPSHATSSSG